MQTKGDWKSLNKLQTRNDLKQTKTIEMVTKLESAKRLVTIAISSNLIMFGGKCYAFVDTKSASMFAECMHSLADVMNESLLIFGLIKSLKMPDLDHPYGFIAERYAYALISGVGVFFLGGGVSLMHGLNNIFAETHIATADLTSAVVALGACFLFESITLSIAVNHIWKQAKDAKQSFWEYFNAGADPASVQVFVEDAAATCGIILASGCLAASSYCNLPIMDSVGSICIGLLLAGAGMFLIRRNIKNLIQVRMDFRKEQEIVNLLLADPIVKSVHDVKSVSIGSDWSRFKCEILFNGKAVSKKYISANPQRYLLDLSLLKESKNPEELENVMVRNGDEIIQFLAKEVDRLELEIQKIRPEVKHIDLEIL